MCDIIEEYVAQRIAELEAKMIIASRLDSLKNLMKKTNWPPEEAMDAIGIPKSDYPQYLALL